MASDVLLHPRAISTYAVEYCAEMVRCGSFPDRPSRLSALYAFGDMEGAERASSFYGWPLDTVRRFRLVEFPLTRVAKCNMQIVSLVRSVWASLDVTTQQSVFDAYWSGHGDLALDLPGPSPDQRREIRSGVVWEYLIDGVLKLDD